VIGWFRQDEKPKGLGLEDYLILRTLAEARRMHPMGKTRGPDPRFNISQYRFITSGLTELPSSIPLSSCEASVFCNPGPMIRYSSSRRAISPAIQSRRITHPSRGLAFLEKKSPWVAPLSRFEPEHFIDYAGFSQKVKHARDM
jgi:hypothetical protein